MRIEYDKRNGDHIKSQKAARTKEYHKLVSPTAKANYDVDLFLNEYFLKDQSRAIKAMQLPGLANRSVVHAAAEKIHGLHTISHGREPNRTLAIGWDRNAIYAAAASGSAEQVKQSRTQDDPVWEARMEKHQALVKKCEIPSDGQQVCMPFFYGNFAIRCDEIAEQWSEGASSYNLRFVGGRSAIFNFGVLEGVMRFGPDQESVTRDEYDSEDDYADSSDEDDKDESPPLKTSNRTAPNPSKRPMHNPPPSARAPKRAKPSSSSTPLRLYLQWRGRETGESQIQLDSKTDPTHTGHIDFSDARCVTFSGVADFGFVGRQVRFEGFETQHLGGPQTKKWGDYSEEMYERERVGRWR